MKNCLYLCGLLFLICFSCRSLNQRKASIIPEKNAVIGLNSVISMDSKSTTLLLKDYFIDPALVDSVISTYWNCTLSEENRHLGIMEKQGIDIPLISVIQVFSEGYPYAIPIKKSNKKLVKIAYPASPEIQTVSLFGEMTSWSPIPMKKNREEWFITQHLSPGSYQYLLEVNGKQILDPNNPNTATSGIGTTNSLLEVPKTDPNKIPQLRTLRHSGNSIYVSVEKTEDLPLVLIDNFQLGADHLKLEENILSISLDRSLSTKKRSFIRIWAQNEEAISNDLLIPLEYGKVLDDPAELDRMDKEAMIMYFPLVDRFANGNTDNDDPVEDDRVLPLANYLGGDLEGIIQKIEEGYFATLGVNTIWLSPITQNPYEAYQEYIEPQRWYTGYHGYWPIYSNTVDYRFGTNEDLRRLVEVAHENGINVLLDFICNHVHEKHTIYQEHPEWATSLELPDGRKNLRLWDEQRLTTWFDTFLPSLDLEDPEVIDLQSDSALFWVKEFGLDGFRQDASKHVSLDFWRTLTRKLKDSVVIPQDRPIYQIGETYASNELINTYISSGLLDAQFDFNLSGKAKDVLIKEDLSLSEIADQLEGSLEIFGHHHSMGNITGNHDQPRFMAYAGGDLSFDEDSREAGFERTIVVKDEHGYQKLRTMTAFLMTIPGIPVIYYGDEFGMVGANDPDNRRMMRFDSLSSQEAITLENARELGKLRKNKLALLYGDLEILKSSADQLVFLRNYFGETAILVISKGKAQEITFEVPEKYNIEKLKAHLDLQFSVSDRTLRVNTEKDGYQILYN